MLYKANQKFCHSELDSESSKFLCEPVCERKKQLEDPESVSVEKQNRLRIESGVTTVNNVSERSNNIEILRLHSSLRMTRGKCIKKVNHFLTSLPTNLLSLKPAFTLAEVLITLGIIGVVAAITIPNLIQKNFEKQTVVKLRETQSILTQAIKMAEEEYGEVPGWGITGHDVKSANIIFNNIKPFLKVALECGLDDSKGRCMYPKNYKMLNGQTYGGNHAIGGAYYKFLLLNGAGIWCRGDSEYKGGSYIICYIDVNGKSQPNTIGKDLFDFYYSNGSIVPVGGPDDKRCNKNNNGWGCAWQVLHNQNMNYLH